TTRVRKRWCCREQRILISTSLTRGPSSFRIPTLKRVRPVSWVFGIGPFGLSSCFKAETYEFLDARRSGGITFGSEGRLASACYVLVCAVIRTDIRTGK